jgi:prophage DNA circulation protein
MSSIRDIRNPWRDKLLPASFRGAEFHVEAMAPSGGRRLVVHEFPKKNVPYAEDMGRMAMSFMVRGYVIAYVRDTAYPLYQRDYTLARDRLLEALNEGGGGRLQLPSLPSVIVACDRYRLTEEDKAGGYASFDMQFVEQGEAPGVPPPSSRDTLLSQAAALNTQVLLNLSQANIARQEELAALSVPEGLRVR